MPPLSKRISSLSPYPFAEIERIATELKNSGVNVIDFGVGDPIDPTPEFIRAGAKIALDTHAASGYPSYIGSARFREAVGNWFEKRFHVKLNPATEITSSIGSKEAIFNFPLAFIDPPSFASDELRRTSSNDVVLIPTPGYPPYARGTTFAGGVPYFLPLLPENNFLPDLEKIPNEIVERAKILWLNYPNSPSGALAPDEFYRRAVEFCKKNDIILASDLAYSEIYYPPSPEASVLRPPRRTTEDESEDSAPLRSTPPKSILEFAREGVIEFHSLSKRSRMTGYRVGFVVGDEKLIAAFRKVKTNIDSGTPSFLQESAITALTDESHVEASRKEYQEKRDLLVSAFTALGLPKSEPESTFYVWQKIPAGMTSEVFAKKLLAPELGIVATPGSLISDVTAEGVNPGEGFVRFALVPTVAKVREAAERIRENLKI